MTSEIIDSMKLSEVFSALKPTHVLGTTYTLSLTFFESVVWPYIDKSKLKRCLILCDKFGYRQAMFEAASLRHASTSYMAMPVNCKGSFHPKVWLLTDGNKTVLLVGSGNLTQTGFIENTELFSVIMLDSDNMTELLSNDIRSFLQGITELMDGSSESGQFAQSVLNELIRMLPAGRSDLTGQRFYSSFQGALVPQLAKHGTGGELYVASPYFGGEVVGLSLLLSGLEPQKTTLFPAVIDSDQLDIDLNAVKGLGVDDIALLALGEIKNGFPHLKLYGHTSELGESWMYCGSANCTKAALAGDNIEAGLVIDVDAEIVERYFSSSENTLVAQNRFTRVGESSVASDALTVTATFLGDNIVIRLSGHSSKISPLVDVTITLRSGGRRYCTNRSILFTSDNKDRISLQDFAGFKFTPFCSYHLEIRASTLTGKQIESSCLVDDIAALTASAQERGACRALSQVIRGEIPELADMLQYFNLIDTALENGIDVNSADTDQAKQQSQAGENKAKIPLWPPRPVFHAASGHAATHGTSVYFWLDKIVSIFVDKHPKHHVRHIIDTEAGGGDADHKDANSKSANDLTGRWKKSEEYTERLKVKLSSADIDAKKAQAAYPAICSLHVMRLSLRGQAEDVFQSTANADNALATIGQIALDLVNSLFNKRYDSSGRCRKSIASACTVDFEVPLYRQFALLVLAAFCNIRLSPTSSRSIQLNAWLEFKDICADHFETYAQDIDVLWSVYGQHFIVKHDDATKDDLRTALQEIKKIGWKDHKGYQSSKCLYLLSSGQDIDMPDGMFVPTDLAKFRTRIKRGLPLVVTGALGQEFCTAEKCPQRYFVQADVKRKISMTEPVICPACGIGIIPEQIFHLLVEGANNE